jgi:hypothetical protein
MGRCAKQLDDLLKQARQQGLKVVETEAVRLSPSFIVKAKVVFKASQSPDRIFTAFSEAGESSARDFDGIETAEEQAIIRALQMSGVGSLQVGTSS